MLILIKTITISLRVTNKSLIGELSHDISDMFPIELNSSNQTSFMIFTYKI